MGIFELDNIKENEMKEKTIKEYKQRLWLVLKSKLNGKNKITAIYAWAVTVFRYGSGILQWYQRFGQEVKGNNYCMEHYIWRVMWTDCTLRRKREAEVWRVWNVVLEKREIVWVFNLSNFEKNHIRGVAAAETILKIL